MKKSNELLQYKKLLDAIKSSNISKKYNPKKYSFNLDNFDKKGEIKKEN